MTRHRCRRRHAAADAIAAISSDYADASDAPPLIFAAADADTRCR